MVNLQRLKSKVSESLLRQISFQVEKAPRQKKRFNTGKRLFIWETEI